MVRRAAPRNRCPPRGHRRAATLRLEVRLDAFNVLNHAQFTGVNNVPAFASLSERTITNLAHDTSGNVVRNNGFGRITGVRLPRTLQLVTRPTF